MGLSKTMKLNNGVEIPVLGLGTYDGPKGVVGNAIKAAIDIGYRHFDCAWFYGNEDEIGTAIKEKIQEGVVKREDLFITSKLWNNFHEKDQVVPMIKVSLKALQLNYLDLYLVHWPFGVKKETSLDPSKIFPEHFNDVDYLETWKAMEECVKLGLTKSIGVSNFNAEQIERLLKNCTIKPVVNQVELNPNLNQKKLIQFCKERGIILTAYCPLGRIQDSDNPGCPTPTLLDPKVIEIAKKYNKTPAQVILNYIISLGVTAIPKSVNESRLKANIDVFDFTLDPEDVTYLDSCNKNQRVCPFPEYKTHKYYSFHSEF